MKAKVVEKPYLFKKFKSYKAEEILAVGGATAFGKLIGSNHQKLFQIKGEELSEDDVNKALKMLSK